MAAHTNLKVQVKNGTMEAKRALDIMRKRKNWADVQNSRTARWLLKRV